MSMRSTANPRSRLAAPCVVEYLGHNVSGKGMMTNLSRDGMEILGSHATPTGMRLALQLSASDSALLIQIPYAYV